MSIQKSNYNIAGAIGLYKKECKRFFSVYIQTVISPIISSLTFFAIIIFIRPQNNIFNISFEEFIIPGLIIMSIVQNSFSNSSSSIVVSKMGGTIYDLLIVPLSPFGITMAYAAAGITRGIMITIVSFFVFNFIIDIQIYDFSAFITYIFLGSLMMSLLGIIAGYVCKGFEQMSSVSVFLIVPLSMLSGMFYSIKQLPDILYTISTYNPIFYIIDGFRYSMINIHDQPLSHGIISLIIINVIFFFISFNMIKKGYGIKE